MGGFGSGNHHHRHRAPKRRTVDAALILSMDTLRGSDDWQCGGGTITWVSTGGEKNSVTWRIGEDTEEIILDYTSGSDTIHEVIPLEKRPQKVGGVRYFFCCPACGRRALKLYGLRRFLCRTCQNLTYQSCQESGSMFRRLLVSEGIVESFSHLFGGIKITPYTATALLMETLSGALSPGGEVQGKTYRRLVKKQRNHEKRKQAVRGHPNSTK